MGLSFEKNSSQMSAMRELLQSASRIEELVAVDVRVSRHGRQVG
jgi:hypothetical protein